MNQAYIFEIQKETESTRRLISLIQDEHLDYKPHEKSMSLGKLAAHVVELHNWVSDALDLVEFDFAADYKPLIIQNASDLLTALDNGLDKNIERINSLTEEDWNAMWTARFGEHIVAQMPKAATYRYMIQNHLIHHRGQLTVYMRMLDIPLPGLYGPSADEQQG